MMSLHSDDTTQCDPFAKVNAREKFACEQFAKVYARKKLNSDKFAKVYVRENNVLSIRESLCSRKFLLAKVSARESFLT